MDLKDIQELIKFVAKSGATEVDLEIDNIKISIKSPEKKRRGEVDEITTIIQQPTSSVMSAPVVTATAIASTPEVDENANYITIKSSMIGTFYRSSSPETPSFVNIGDTIKKGDTLCIIEAMKLFNEIESEVSCKIVKVLVDDTTPIEFDQPLFLVDPS
ncbi:MAG: acetyl-CoA carboxylase biotin carboxyl carrier protein [Cryomorphaceae bacterium]|nr:acetyl-CoA carboxylase biotin carboxyl carrier protein [Cryomorphaceae bacterium]